MFGEDFWVTLALNSIDSPNAVISDVRFKNEAEAIKRAGGQIWRINRFGVGPVTNHASEIDLDNYDFDHLISNDLSVLELNKVIDNILESQNV